MDNLPLPNIDEILDDVYKRTIASSWEKQGSYWLNFLDNFLWWITPWTLTVVWWNTGVWKSEFCKTVVWWNINKGKKVAFFGLEGAKWEIFERGMYWYVNSKLEFWIDHADYIVNNFKNKRVNKLRLEYIEKQKKLCRRKLYYFDNRYIKNWINDLIYYIEKLLQTTHIDILIIDHLWLLLNLTNANENLEATTTVTKLVHFIEDKKLPTILVSHIRKQPTSTLIWERLKAPWINDLMWSSNISRLAYTIIMLHRFKLPTLADIDTKIKDFENQDVIQFRILKNRQSGSKIANLTTTYDLKNNKYHDTIDKIIALDDNMNVEKINLSCDDIEIKKKVEQKERLPLNDELPVETKEIKLDDEWDPILTLN